MKYDMLRAYRSFLEGTLRPATARTYTNRLDNLLVGQSIIDPVGKLDITKVIHNLSKIKYKNHFSQSKNAFLYFLKYYNIILDDHFRQEITHLEQKTRKKYRSLSKSDLKKMDRTIKHLKNKKLKLSYQTILATGMRVMELSQITLSDSMISTDEIEFSFIGKGGHKESVKLFKKDNPKLYDNLLEQIEKTDQTKKVFYSAVYLQKKSKELGFKCHDLRRAYAKLEYRKTKSKEDVMEKLRHKSIKTTNLYLRSKVKI